jgi:hypothetical protein
LHKQGITTINGNDNEEELLEESFRRYSQLWLPFVAHHHRQQQQQQQQYRTNSGREKQTHTDTTTDIALIPPPDIAWFWHCHRLAPYRYAKYVQRKYFRTGPYIYAEYVQRKYFRTGHHNGDGDGDGDDDGDGVFKFLDPSHPFVFQLETNNEDCNDTWRWRASLSLLLSSSLTNPGNDDYAIKSQSTRDLFAEMYPNESFFLVSSPSASPVKGLLLGGFDLIESCKRQATFLWQVSGPKFLLENNDINDMFLKEGITNYSRFVKLTNHPQRRHILVPTYQIDLMWHTHILSSIKNYHEDVKKLTATTTTSSSGGSGSGSNSRIKQKIILNHDDSIDNDRSKGSVLDTSFQQTRNLWKDVYVSEYVVLGGMYRGEPPPEYYHMDWNPSSHSPSASAFASISSTFMTYTANYSSPIDSMTVDHDEAFGWMPLDHDEAFLSPSSPDVAIDTYIDPTPLEGYIYGLGGTCVCVCVYVCVCVCLCVCVLSFSYVFCFDSLLYSFWC